MNFEYRMHDTRVGRFFAVDPLAKQYPHNSPYAFSENRVIDGIELEGLEVQHYTLLLQDKEKPVLTNLGVQTREKEWWEFFDNGNNFTSFNGNIIKQKLIVVHMITEVDEGIAGWGNEGTVNVQFESEKEFEAWVEGGYGGSDGQRVLKEAAVEAKKDRMIFVVASVGSHLASLSISISGAPVLQSRTIARNNKLDGVVSENVLQNSKIVNFGSSLDNLPGASGIKIDSRLSDAAMTELTNRYGVEFAQVYRLGPGKNGAGGQYYLHSGDASSVTIYNMDKNTMLINHTHPAGTPFASKKDRTLLEKLEKSGSPQRSSEILPSGRKKSTRFNKNGVNTTDKNKRLKPN